MITHEELKRKLKYSPKTGLFQWIHNLKMAGFPVSGGRYWGIGINGKVYRRGRLAWFYINGKWPDKHIDHINGDRMDDRISNLRDVDRLTNAANLERHRNGYLVGTTHVLGRKKPWLARAKKAGKTKCLGYYKTQKEAHEAYKRHINTKN